MKEQEILKLGEEAEKDQIKIREKFLSKVPSEGATIVYEQTGEVRTIYPPIKQGSQGITITFKK